MMFFHKSLASVFGIGFIKGGGSIAAAVTCAVWMLLLQGQPAGWGSLIVVVAITLLGVWNGNLVEKDWGKDSSRVVIDEVAGMGIGLLFAPSGWQTVLAAFVLFRFFDISKVLGVRKMEIFPGGWGVMADDVLAGVYTFICVQLLVKLNLF